VKLNASHIKTRLGSKFAFFPCLEPSLILDVTNTFRSRAASPEEANFVAKYYYFVTEVVYANTIGTPIRVLCKIPCTGYHKFT